MAKKEIKIPWDKEESGGGRGKFKEDDYLVKIVSAKSVRSKEKDTPGIEFVFKFKDGKYKGKKLTENVWITPKSLRRLRMLCSAVGIKTPKKAAKLDLSKFPGKELGIAIEDDVYKNSRGKKVKSSTVAFEGFMSVDELESGGVDEEDSDDTDDSDASSDDASSSDASSDDDSDASSDDSDVSIDSDSL